MVQRADQPPPKVDWVMNKLPLQKNKFKRQRKMLWQMRYDRLYRQALDKGWKAPPIAANRIAKYFHYWCA